MITEKEFKEQFGFEPKHDDLHRVNCDQAGEAGHSMCGLCSNCGRPCFICGGRCWGLRGLGLERVGDELFALPDEENRFPVVRVFKPVDAQRLGVETDLDAVFIVRERALSETAYKAIIEESGIGDLFYRPLTGNMINEIKGRINNCIMKAMQSGNLFKNLTGVWQWE